MLDDQELIATQMLNCIIPRDGDFKFRILGYEKTTEDENTITYTNSSINKKISFDLVNQKLDIRNRNNHYDIATEEEENAIKTKQKELGWK